MNDPAEGLKWLHEQLAWERRLEELRRAHLATQRPAEPVDVLARRPAA